MVGKKDEFVYTWDDTDMPHDRLVIIGNGFDLECGLHTSYGDFLAFVSALEDAQRAYASNFQHFLLIGEHLHRCESVDTYRAVRDSLKVLFEKRGVNKTVTDMALTRFDNYCDHKAKEYIYYILPQYLSELHYVRLFDNYWYKHFRDASYGNGWVDFESEIAVVIEAIEDSMRSASPRQATLDDMVTCSPIGKMSFIIRDLYDFDTSASKSLVLQSDNAFIVLNHLIQSNGITYRNLRARLLDDLNEFIAVFEAYLLDYVEQSGYRMTPAITAIVDALRSAESPKDTHVITFNYTSTLERMLKEEGIDVGICYVHGRLGDGSSKSRLVLGMDEYLDDADVRTMTDFAMFRKYNQRIYKRADSSYARWLRDYADYRATRHEVIVMGHSLAASDHDLLRRVFSLENTRVAVYYHDDDSFSELLANMTAMMGKDFLIERTASDKRTLEFVDQREL